MARIKRKPVSIIARLRNYFITGIVVLVPIGITLYLTKFFISISSKLVPDEINPRFCRFNSQFKHNIFHIISTDGG